MITFKNDNNVIVYTLEKIIDYARRNHYIFMAQCVWWLASIIGLESGLFTHIDNLHIHSEVYQASSVSCSNPVFIHPHWLLQIGEPTSDQEDHSSWELSELESDQSSTSEDNLCDEVLKNC